MNKQRKTYILLAAVIIIWSIVGFQFLDYLKTDDEVVSDIEFKKFVPKEIKKKELYKVSTHERDPFLGKYNIPTKKVKSVTRKKKEPIVFPNIQFKGTINSDGKLLFILMVDGAQRIVSLNESVNDFQIIKGSAKEVKIKYKGEVKTYSK